VTRFTISHGEYVELLGFLVRNRRNGSDGQIAIVEEHLKSTSTGGEIVDLTQILPALAALLKDYGARGRLETLLRRARIFSIQQRSRANGLDVQPVAPSAPQPAARKPVVAPKPPPLLDVVVEEKPAALPAPKPPKVPKEKKPAPVRLTARRIAERWPRPLTTKAKMLADPKALAWELSARRDAIVAQLSKLPGVDARELASVTVVQLVSALKIAGKISPKDQRYERFAGALEIALQSPLIRSVPPNALVDAESVLRFLLAYRDRIGHECRQSADRAQRARGHAMEAGELYSLCTLNDALYMAGKIPESLRDQIDAHAAAALEHFLARRELIEPEVRRLGSSSWIMSKIDRSLFTPLRGPSRHLHATFTLAIVKWARWLLSEGIPAAGSAPASASDVAGVRAFIAGYASSERLAQSSELLKRISRRALVDSIWLARELAELRPRLLAEQARLRRVSPHDLEQLSLPKIFEATATLHALPGARSEYERRVGQMELVRRAPELRAIKKEDLAEPARLVAALVAIQPHLSQPARPILGSEPQSMEYLVEALETADILKGDIGPVEEYAKAFDLWNGSTLLRAIDDADMKTPAGLVACLEAMRGRIVLEQRALRRLSPKDLKTIPIRQLALALVIGKRLEGDVDAYLHAAGSRLARVYAASPKLREIAATAESDREQFLASLVTFRDRIAVEYRRAERELPPEAFTFPQAEEYFSLPTLIETLQAAGVLTEGVSGLKSSIVNPLDYYLKRRAVLSAEVAKAGMGRISLAALDLSRFTRQDDSTQGVSSDYTRNIVKQGRWLERNAIPLRSIYGAEEMAAIMRAEHEAFLRTAPASIADGLAAAAARSAAEPAQARAEAVGILAALAGYVEALRNAEGELTPALETGLAQARRFVEWNSDALADPAVGVEETASELFSQGPEALPDSGETSQEGAPGVSLPAMLPAPPRPLR
jgi:hypothetical protein